MADGTEGRDSVVIERTLHAPAEVVWRMWTDPQHFASWYGPDGAEVTVVEMDVRVGGRRFVGMEMATPAGPRRMWFVGEHVEVEDDRRLVYTESIADERGTVLDPTTMGMPPDHPVTTRIVVELAASGGRTRMVVTHFGVPADSPGATGWNMAFDKLVARLAES